MISKLYKALSIIFTFVVLYFLIAQIDPQSISTIFTKIRADFLIIAFFSYFFLNWLRARRFHLLLGRKIGIKKIFSIGLVHNFLNNILPARTGELSYLYYVRKSGAVGMGENLASLFLARIFDTLATVLLLMAALIPIAASIINLKQVVTLAVSGLFLVIAIFCLFLFWGKKVLRLINWVFALLRLEKFSLGGKILLKLQEAILLIGQLRRSNLIYQIALLTVVIWLIIFLRVWFIALGFGLDINFWHSIFIGAFPTLVSIVPFYAVGNFGIFEGSTTLAMVLLGINKELAIGFSFLLHLVNIFIAAIPGIIAYWKLRK